jgi:crotonobetainyl-CoA:carnitine CoA-transferase CaiB-like acyl-CoA transferase
VAPYGAYLTADEQTLVLGTTNDREWRRLALDVLGRLPPPESPDWDWRLDPIPALGEHTVGVLGELGFGPGDLADMRAAGAIDA